MTKKAVFWGLTFILLLTGNGWAVTEQDKHCYNFLLPNSQTVKPSITEYVKRAKETLDQNWKSRFKYLKPSQYKITAVVAIEPSGEITNSTIIDSSGIQRIDQSFLEAIHLSSPLPKWEQTDYFGPLIIQYEGSAKTAEKKLFGGLARFENDTFQANISIETLINTPQSNRAQRRLRHLEKEYQEKLPVVAKVLPSNDEFFYKVLLNELRVAYLLGQSDKELQRFEQAIHTPLNTLFIRNPQMFADKLQCMEVFYNDQNLPDKAAQFQQLRGQFEAANNLH